MVLPLKNNSPIERRLSVVSFFKEHQELSFELSQRLKNIGDLERLISKVAVGKVNPREVAHLKRTLTEIPSIKDLLQKKSNPKGLTEMLDRLDPCEKLVALIDKTLAEEPAGQFGKGEVIHSGWNKELDELREIAYHGKDFLAEMQKRESERTGIPSLIIAFNYVFGSSKR